MRRLGRLTIISPLNWLQARLSLAVMCFFVLYFGALYLGDAWAEKRVIDPWKLDPEAEAPNAYIDGYFLFEVIVSGIFWMIVDVFLELATLSKGCLDSRAHAAMERQSLVATYRPPEDAVILPIRHRVGCRIFLMDVLLTKIPILVGKSAIHFFSIGGAAMIQALYNVILNDFLSKDDDDPAPIEEIYADGLDKCRRLRNVIIVGQCILFLVSRILSASIAYGDSEESQHVFSRLWNSEKKTWSYLNECDKAIGSVLFSWPKKSRQLTLQHPLRVLPAEIVDETELVIRTL